MVGGSLHRSCSSAYRRVTGKGGSSKGKAKKRRARQEEEEHEEEELAQVEPAREEPAQEEEPPQDADYEPKTEEASGGEHEADDTSGDTIGSVYQRGRTRLSEGPIPVAQRPLIKPEGTR
jgi:hypothetical protein